MGKTIRTILVETTDEKLDVLEQVLKLEGKSMSSLVEEAIDREIYPFTSEGGVFDPVEGVFEGKKCLVLYSTTMMGNCYKCIFLDGKILKIPSELVELTRGNQK